MSEGRPLRLLHIAVFFSSFDRLVVAPLLLVIAFDLGVSLPAVTAMATMYLVGYGIMQVAWGMVSDRLGRVRTVRLALLIAAVASFATALAPSLDALVASRLVAGGAFAAVMPGTLIYVGDTVPISRRHGALTDVMMATALGMSTATLVGASMADFVSWRLAFVVPGGFVLGVVVLMRRMPEVRSTTRAVLPSVLARLTTVLRNRWALMVLIFAFTEGMVLLGVLNYLPTALQSRGVSTTMSGVVTAAYGVAIIVFSRMVKRLARRQSSARLMAIGGAFGVVAYVSLVADPDVVGVLVGCILLAGAWAFMHSTMQTWATEVAPDARATMVSLFASALFLGSAAWTAYGADFADREDYVAYFAVGFTVTIVLAVTAVVMRARYPD